jgi:hypothetical protein
MGIIPLILMDLPPKEVSPTPKVNQAGPRVVTSILELIPKKDC